MSERKFKHSKDFILCYRNPHNINWSCESGYKSLEEINERASELRQKEENITTTFFNFGSKLPDIIRRFYILKNLAPDVIINPKDNINEKN
jgi:hypothetical protein